MSERAEQMQIPDVPTEHLRGQVPADPAVAAADRQAYYTQLRAEHGEPTCLPAHGVHVFDPQNPYAACLCGAQKPPKGAS